MKNILLLVHDDAGQEARFQAALDITRALEGHLTCVDVAQMPSVTGDYYGAPMAAILLDDERGREAENRSRLELRLMHEDLTWDWIDTTGDLAEAVLAGACLADLIVVNRKLDAALGPDMHSVASRMVMRAQKPVVAVPDDQRCFEVNGRALIAWDGSPSVSATMRACVPLLKLASEVRIFTVEDGSEQAPAEDAAAYLSRQGIHPSVRRITDWHHRIDGLIVEECATWKADWCLMGAYGQGRLTEMLFGGVTRRMLGNSQLPLVLGH